MIGKILKAAVVVTFFLSALVIFSILGSLRNYLTNGPENLMGYGGALSSVTVASAQTAPPTSADNQEREQKFHDALLRLSQRHRVSLLYIPDRQLNTATLVDPARHFALEGAPVFETLADPAARTALVFSRVPPQGYEALLPETPDRIEQISQPYRLDQARSIDAFTTPALQPLGTGTYYLTTADPVAISIMERLSMDAGYQLTLTASHREPTFYNYFTSGYSAVYLLATLTLAVFATTLSLIYLVSRRESMATALALGASRYQAQFRELARLFPALCLASLMGAGTLLVYCFLAPRHFSPLFVPLAAAFNIVLWAVLIWVLLSALGRRFKRVLPC